jgi:hypothetical protein
MHQTARALRVGKTPAVLRGPSSLRCAVGLRVGHRLHHSLPLADGLNGPVCAPWCPGKATGLCTSGEIVNTYKRRFSSQTVAALLALTSVLSVGFTVCAQAAGKSSPSTAQQRRQAETDRCMKIADEDVRMPCISDATARFDEAQPYVPDPDPGRYARNVFKRCDPLTEPDRSDCVARMQGKGTTTGSVAAGGIYRELVTREVAPVAATAANAASAATSSPVSLPVPVKP